MGLSVVSMLALWSGLHLLSLLRGVMVSPMQGLPALVVVQILGGRVTKKSQALSDGLSLILQRACVIMSLQKSRLYILFLMDTLGASCVGAR